MLFRSDLQRWLLLTKELAFIQNTYGIQDEEIRLMMRNAVDTAFASDDVKEKLYFELGLR